MKSTALTQKHQSLGAKMAPFAGFTMPISYSSIKEEHACVRKGVGVFDVSHMGEFILKGDGALDLIQRVTSNDASTLTPGQAQYSCFPNKSGGIVDDLIVYHLEDGNYMLVVNASNISKDFNWVKAHNTDGVALVDISDNTSLLAVQGPKTNQALQSLTDVDLGSIPFYHVKKGRFAGVDNVLISATGYTGSGGFELYFNNKYAQIIWDKIFESGAEFNIKPCGLAARDTLRLEMGYCLYGNEIDDSTSPIEAGLAWITKTKKEVDFNSKSIFKAQKKTGVDRKLVALQLIDKGIARSGYDIVNDEGKSIGKITSGTQSPSTGKSIALGYVPTELSTVGAKVNIQIRNKVAAAKVVKLPFYKS